MVEQHLTVHCRHAYRGEGQRGQGRPGLDTKHKRRVSEPGCALHQLWREAAGSPVPRKGPKEAAQGPAPSPGRREHETLSGSSGGHERQLSGHRGPTCTCCPTEDKEAVGAVTVSLRSWAAGSWSLLPGACLRISSVSVPLCQVRCLCVNREGGGPPRPRRWRVGGFGRGQRKGSLGDLWGRLPLRKRPRHCSGRSSRVGGSGGQALLSNPSGCQSRARRHRAPWGSGVAQCACARVTGSKSWE